MIGSAVELSNLKKRDQDDGVRARGMAVKLDGAWMDDTWHRSKDGIDVTFCLPQESYKYPFTPFIFYFSLSVNIFLRNQAQAKKLGFPFGRRVIEVRS